MKNIINILNKKTKYGFTLIELISVIIIIGVIALISVPITINIISKVKEKSYKETISNIELSAYNYSVYNNLGYNRLFKSLPISTIKLAGYLDNEDIIDPRDNSIIDGCVMYRYIPDTKTYELFYSSTCDEKNYYPEVTINVLNDNNKEWLNEKIKFTISGEYGQFKYCIGKNECNPDIYYNGETTLDTEGIDLAICATGYFGDEIGLSTCTKLYNIDYTKPDITYTTPMTTNKITISSTCTDNISGVREILYSLDGSDYTNKYVYTNIEYKEHNVSVKCIDNAGNINVLDKKITPPEIKSPEIVQIDWYPKTTWAQWRLYKIKFNVGNNDINIETPYYYFKSTVKATITDGSIVEECGTDVKPSNCNSISTTNISPNIWYRTNDKEINIKLEASKEDNIRGINAGIIYATIYDGTNLSTTSTGMINYMDKENPEITSINAKLYTNKINVIPVCQDQTGLSGIKEMLYSLDGSPYQQSNVFSNVEEGTHVVKVKCIDNALNEVEQSKSMTPPKIVNPAISQYSQSPSGTWAQNRVVKIAYDNTNIETPYYYFKSQVRASVLSGVVVESCGIENTPSTCTKSNITELVENTWYRTNNKEILLTYKENIVEKNKILYAITYDGTNFSSSSTHTIGLIDVTKPNITINVNNIKTDRVTLILTCNDTESGITKYEYSKDNGVTWNIASGSSYTYTGLRQGTNYQYVGRCTNGSGLTNIANSTNKTYAITKPIMEQISQNPSSGIWALNRTIKITYSNANIENPKHYYSYDNKNWTIVNGTTINLIFTNNSLLYARTTDESGNLVDGSTYSVVNIDTEKPTFINWWWGETGGTVNRLYIKATDNVSIDKVQCPTSTESGNYNNWIWFNAVWDSNADAYRCDITPSTFNHYGQEYITHLYIYDHLGNGGYYNQTSIEIPSACSLTSYKDKNGSWGSCSADCGGGTQSYTVTRTYYSNYTGQYCSEEQVVIKTQSCNTQSCKTCTVNLFDFGGGYDNWGCSCYGWPNQKQECDNIGGTWNGSSCTAAHNYGYMNFSSCKAISDTSVCETSDNNCDGYPG